MFGGSAMNMLVLHSTTNKQCFPLVVLSHLAGASKTSFTTIKIGKCFQGDVVFHLDWNFCKCYKCWLFKLKKCKCRLKRTTILQFFEIIFPAI